MSNGLIYRFSRGDRTTTSAPLSALAASTKAARVDRQGVPLSQRHQGSGGDQECAICGPQLASAGEKPVGCLPAPRRLMSLTTPPHPRFRGGGKGTRDIIAPVGFPTDLSTGTLSFGQGVGVGCGTGTVVPHKATTGQAHHSAKSCVNRRWTPICRRNSRNPSGSPKAS